MPVEEKDLKALIRQHESMALASFDEALAAFKVFAPADYLFDAVLLLQGAQAQLIVVIYARWIGMICCSVEQQEARAVAQMQRRRR